jgi:hypothetical protein
MLCEYIHNVVMPIPVKDETGVEKETVGYTDHLKATLGRYGLTRICPATATIGYDNSDSSTIPRRKAILWTDIRSPPQLPTGTLLSTTILNMREGHIGWCSSKHHKPMTCKRKE